MAQWFSGSHSALAAGAGVIGREHAANETDDGQAMLAVIARGINVPPAISVLALPAASKRGLAARLPLPACPPGPPSARPDPDACCRPPDKAPEFSCAPAVFEMSTTIRVRPFHKVRPQWRGKVRQSPLGCGATAVSPCSVKRQARSAASRLSIRASMSGGASAALAGAFTSISFRP